MTLPGEMVADPFCGSGTAGIAAVQLGRKFHGIEINKKYRRIAEGRLAMFGTPPSGPNVRKPKINTVTHGDCLSLIPLLPDHGPCDRDECGRVKVAGPGAVRGRSRPARAARRGSGKPIAKPQRLRALAGSRLDRLASTITLPTAGNAVRAQAYDHRRSPPGLRLGLFLDLALWVVRCG